MSDPPLRRAQEFASTQWSMVLRAGRGSVEAQQAMEQLCELYWYPIYAFARRRGASAQEAEDLTQGFFVRVLEKEFFRDADPERGRFRSFLLTIFKRYWGDERDKARALKRGGRVHHLSIDFPSAEDRYRAEPVDGWTAEKLFERRWAITLLDRTLAELERSYVEKGKSEFFASTRLFLTASPGDESYEDVAERLSMKKETLRVAVHRMRASYRKLLEEEVVRTLASPDDFENELETLQMALRGES